MSIRKNNKQIRDSKTLEENITPFNSPLRRSPLARKLLIKGENLRQFEEMRANILKENPSRTEIEKVLCEKIISAAWKLRRAMELERNLLNAQNKIDERELYDSELGSTSRKRIRNIRKVRISSSEIQQVIQYQLELEKGMQKAIERLREEQALRKSSLAPQKRSNVL